MRFSQIPHFPFNHRGNPASVTFFTIHWLDCLREIHPRFSSPSPADHTHPPPERITKFCRKMKSAVILFASVLLVGCASPNCSTAPQPPYSIATFQPDVLPLSSEDSMDLADLLLTLPVFDISPNHRRSWIDRNGIKSKSRDRLTVGGDGSQSPLTIEKIPPASNSKLRIRLTVEPWDDPDTWIYELQRADNGWILQGIERRRAEQGH